MYAIRRTYSPYCYSPRPLRPYLILAIVANLGFVLESEQLELSLIREIVADAADQPEDIVPEVYPVLSTLVLFDHPNLQESI